MNRSILCVLCQIPSLFSTRKRPTLLVLFMRFILFIPFIVSAIAEVDAPPSALPKASVTHPALWKVTPTAELATDSTTAYLFGSIHLGNKTMYPLAEPIMAAFQQSEYLVVELDITAINPIEVGSLLLEKGMYSGAETLENALSPATWIALKRALTRHQLSAESFTKHRPWLVAVMLSSLEFQRAGYDEAHGIDNYFLEQAKGHKSIIELESFTEQMDMFTQFSPREQEAFLIATVRELEQGTQYIESLVAAWMKGDEQTLNRLMIETMKLDPTQAPVYDVFVKNRNIKMAHKIDQLLKENKKLFIVVGSLHIVGEDGLVRLLANRGYQVEKWK